MTTDKLIDHVLTHSGCTIEAKDHHGQTHFLRYLSSGELHCVDPMENTELLTVREFSDEHLDTRWTITKTHGVAQL